MINPSHSGGHLWKAAFFMLWPTVLVFGDVARVDRFEGVVEKRAPGQVEWEKITQGEKLSEGSSVRTGADADLILLTDRGHRLRIRKNTTFHLQTLQADKTEGRLEKGRVVSRVKHLKVNEQFNIQTPTAVCAVRGTEFETAAGDRGTWVAVYKGVVGLSAVDGGPETAVRAGQMSGIQDGTIELPRPIPTDPNAANQAQLTREARREVGLDMSRNDVIAAAALEQRYADYVEGKSLVDVNGRRVRIEEYIVRPRPDQFKFVVLNERQERLDYFYYLGTFNQTLPSDLSVALRDVSGKYGTTAPDYYLTGYEMGQSNTQDSIKDTATGGHLVQIVRDNNGDYVLTDPTDGSNTRTIQDAEDLNNGTFKVYNPLSDSFSIVTAAEKDAATRFGIYLPDSDSFRDFANGDTFWKTRYNSYTHALNNTTKISYTQAGASNILASTLDGTYTYAGGFVLPVVETNPVTLDTTITNYYGDGTYERYRTVLIDDNGNVAPQSAFSGISTGAAYKKELLNWNYQQQVTATEFGDRSIDLVVEPRIFIKSGLIQ